MNVSGRAGVATGPDDDGHAAQRRGLIGRRTLIGLLTIFVLAGLFGLLGVRSGTVSGSDGAVEASVRFARVGRGGVAAPYAITVRSPNGFTGPVTITVEQAYLDLFDQNGVDPSPDSAASTGDELVWEFEQPPGDEFTLTFDIRIGPSVQWGRTGHTVVEAEGRRVELSHHTWVMP